MGIGGDRKARIMEYKWGTGVTFLQSLAPWEGILRAGEGIEEL